MKFKGFIRLLAKLLLAACSFLNFSALQATKLDLNIQAEAAILINIDNGAILYEKNIHTQLFPASITKIATALYTLQVYGDKLDTMIAADHDAIAWVSKEAKKDRASPCLPIGWNLMLRILELKKERFCLFPIFYMGCSSLLAMTLPMS